MFFPPNQARNYRPPQGYPPQQQGYYPPQYQQQPPAQQQYWQQPQNPGQPPYNGMPVGVNQQRPTTSPMTNITSAFKDKDGKFDFNKASTTIDQVVKVGNQISPIVKQVGGFFTKK